MSVKLLLLKSGEDIIANVSEMAFGEDEERRVVGYYLNKPCVVKMRSPNLLPEKTFEGPNNQKAGFQVSLFPWMPLSAEDNIPIPSDWVITMVTPVAKLNEMYHTDVINYGKENDQNTGTSEQSDSNQSD